MLFNPEAVLYWEWGLKWDVSYGVVGEVTNDVTKAKCQNYEKQKEARLKRTQMSWKITKPQAHLLTRKRHAKSAIKHS
jgi:hypothetical protein